jgi:hypothetical protein
MDSPSLQGTLAIRFTAILPALVVNVIRHVIHQATRATVEYGLQRRRYRDASHASRAASSRQLGFGVGIRVGAGSHSFIAASFMRTVISA